MKITKITNLVKNKKKQQLNHLTTTKLNLNNQSLKRRKKIARKRKMLSSHQILQLVKRKICSRSLEPRRIKMMVESFKMRMMKSLKLPGRIINM